MEKEIFRVSGSLQKDFVGQIAYTVCLDSVYDCADIRLVFGKQRYGEITDEIIDAVERETPDKYKTREYTREEKVDICRSLKTEIHLLAMLNDKFIGCIHKQLTDRHMIFSPDFASEGCIPQTDFHGVLKIVVLVFNVLMDDTPYSVSVTMGHAHDIPVSMGVSHHIPISHIPAQKVQTPRISTLRRLELHNHTTESDASITVDEMFEFMDSDGVDAFALTDHNTISGHVKAKMLAASGKYKVECIYGMEYTTYYGHILCLNQKEYLPWEDIDINAPELLFNRVRNSGALAGVAHPFSFGAPFARGCGFDMVIHDFSCVDFIEVFNNPEPLHEVNEPGLLWWESLALSGHRLAITCGMDLHGKWTLAGNYATYVDQPEGVSLEDALTYAIKNERTFITRGPVFEAKEEEKNGVKGLHMFLHPVVKNGYDRDSSKPYTITCRTPAETKSFTLNENGEEFVPFDEFGDSSVIISKLYEGETIIENLTAISPIYRNEEKS